MTRNKKNSIVISVFLVLAVALAVLTIALPTSVDLASTAALGGKVSSPIQNTVSDCSANQFAWDCPGCPTGG
ncbi:MAG: hypothetical protein AB9897_00120 [Anaerolineaceae bacterium]